jgi:predicted  nucleic acid-binding Zn-ribbon protein
MNSGNVPQYIIVPPEAQHILQQLSSSVGGEQRLISTTNSEQFNQIAQALQKVVSSSSTSTTNLDSQNQNQETLLTLLNNHTRMHLPQTIHSHSQDIHSRNRSISSSMDTSMNGNEESSNSSSTAASPMTTHLHNNTIVLGKIKDEPQHVPSLRSSGSSGSPLERINLEHNEVAKKEKKRERNRQAAQKCRTRKLTRIAELQKRVNELQDNNKHLSSTAERLKNDIGKLERQLQEHQTQGCTLVANTSVL